MRIDVPWGTGTTPVELDSRRIAGVLGANVERAADPAAVLKAALAAPSAEFEAFLATAPSPLLVVVNDGTRPTPSADVLAMVRPALEEWLRPSGRELAFVIATGTHRCALPREVERILGFDVAKAHASRIFCHDAKDQDSLVHLGRTKRGTEIWVNRLLAEARSVVLINSVEPHYFAGYTGGRKSLFPGLAGYETVWANHKLSMQAGSEHLVLTGNPVHEDLEEATALGVTGKQVYSVQLVLDKDHRVGFASAGSLERPSGGRGRGRQAVRARDREALRGRGSRGASPHGLQLLSDQQGHPERGVGRQAGGRAHRRIGVPLRPGREPDPVRPAGCRRFTRRGARTGDPGGVPVGRTAGHSCRLHPGQRPDLGGQFAQG